ncbi:MAG: hypothetical protein GC168_00970 [Candidatus Hydrogenedens sp.]|nr:hypothetical protein [Candidatus Hydrogenedens sp.]
MRSWFRCSSCRSFLVLLVGPRPVV